MHYRRLGRTGLKVSDISLGTWVTFGSQVDEPAAVELLQAAYEQGVNYFDTADADANGQAEVMVGKALKTLPRPGVVVSSKVFWPTMPGPNGRGLSRKHIRDSIDQTLRRLGTDYLDIYLCHRFDPDTPIEEVVRSMDDLIHQGKILYWGTSEWTAAQIALAISAARQNGLNPPAVEQAQYSLFHRGRVEVELVQLTRDEGLGLVTWGPLYSGILSGKYNERVPDGSRAALPDMGWVRDRLTPEAKSTVRRLTALADDLDLTTAQLAIAWILRRKDVNSVITGATRIEQLDENLAAAEAVELLTENVLDRIEEIVGEEPV